MIDATTRALLEFAVAYIDANNTTVANTHLNPRTREIEPGSVRREVLAANQWLERARRVLKPAVPEVVQDILRAPLIGPTGEHPAGKHSADDEGALQVAITVDECKVIVKFGVPFAWIGLEAQGAADFAAALIKHAKIAGRKTGRIVKVKL